MGVVAALVVSGRAHGDPSGRPERVARRAHALCVEVGVPVAHILPEYDRAAGIVRRHVLVSLAASFNAHGHTVCGPLDFTVAVHALGIDVVVPVTLVLPGDHGAACAVGGNLGILCAVSHVCFDNRDAVREPLYVAVSVNPLSVDGVSVSGATIVPGDNGTAGTVRADLWAVLFGCVRGDQESGPWLQPVGIDASGEDPFPAVSILPPGDDGAAGVVRAYTE